jgi:opacity protein-like surface antigen
VQPISAVAAVRAGWDYAAVGKSQTVQLLRTDPAPDLFETSQENSSRAVFGALLGIEFPLKYSYPMRWQTGVGFYQTNSFETDGIEYFFSLPEFGNIAYSYNIKNQRVLLENKFLFQMHRYLLGYVLGGVGVSFNTAFNYDEKSLDPITPATGVFQDNTNASLTYSVGLGLEGVVSKNFRIGLGYQYSDLGEIALGQYNNGNTGETLTTMPTSTQEIILQFTAIF